jgi:Na+-driven multidrug efflux pump
VATVDATTARTLSPRTVRLLDAPVLPTLLALAAPNAAVTLLQSGVSVLDAYFVARLGADAIAGVSLVFPVVMLMQTMSSGGMGGGVSAAVARALGAGRRRDADRLATHALLIALAFGVAFSAAALLGGPALYHAMGGRGATLTAALDYSNVVFAGAVAAWTFNTLTNVVRGTGHMTLAATLVLGTSLLQLVLSPTLINGWGYAFLGVGLALYFASQGAGRLRWPVTASVVRLVVAVGGAWLGGRVLGGGLSVVFAAMAVSLVLLGGINMAALAAGAWREHGGVKMPAKGEAP